MSRFYPGGLMKGLTHGAGGGGAQSFLGAVFLGNTLSAAPAVTGKPSGSTFLNANELYPPGVTRGGVTMGTPSQPSANDTNGGDSYGYWYFGGGGEAFVGECANGARTIYALFGVNGGYSHSCRVYDGLPSGTLRYTMPATSSLDSNHRADLAGNVLADSVAIANMVGVPITVTQGKFSIYVNSDFFLNAVFWK